MKRILSSVLAVLLVGMLTCPAFASSTFPDVDEDADYAAAVEYINEIGIMIGDDKGNFNPKKTVTRAEMATIVCRMLGENASATGGTVFSDVSASYWANGYITKAAKLGIVNGYGNGKFGPSDTVTYEQAITMIIRAIGSEDEAVALGGYPKGYVSLAKKYGLLAGITSNSGSNMKRYEIAVMIYNYSRMDSEDTSEETVGKVSLSDGEYSLRIYSSKISTDQNGLECVYAENLLPVTFSDAYVQSLNVGDIISLEKYQLDNIEVESIVRAEGFVSISDYAYFEKSSSSWILVEYDLPLKYVTGSVNLVITEKTKIIDADTLTGQYGQYTEQKLNSVKAYFSNNAKSQEDVNVTVSDGVVVEVYIPYTPV